MKENVRVQQDKSRQLLAACLYKIKETESYVEKVRPFPLSIYSNKLRMKEEKSSCDICKSVNFRENCKMEEGRGIEVDKVCVTS